jgi:two-component system, NarL family, nitrate/nitrite response regulator NarL
MDRKTRIMILDDYPAVRADLRTIVELVEGVEVSGETVNDLNAIPLAAQLQPDLILVDLDTDRRKPSRTDSSEVIRQLKALAPQATIFVLSPAGSIPLDPQALPAGIDASFIKGADTERLLGQIRNFNKTGHGLELSDTEKNQQE